MYIDFSIQEDRQKGSLLGLAIGDAMGAPVEFMKRGTFEPVTVYRSGGKFRLKAGEWTDDTAMALCLAKSLLESEGFDPLDQMNKYTTWMYEGYMSCTGKPIGLGKTCQRSLIRYGGSKQAYTNIKHEKFSGNGSLMRLAPICIYYADNINEAVHYAALSSKTTHGSPIAVDSCRYMSYVIFHLFSAKDKQDIFSQKFKDNTYLYFSEDPLHETLEPIINGDFMKKSESEISSSGYAIHSLEAALWSFYHTDTFEAAILKAVNLGDDADTVGAITGQLSGAYYGLYGLYGIPMKLLTALGLGCSIKTIADQLVEVQMNKRSIK